MIQTTHIKKRMLQRRITNEMLQLVKDYGEYLNGGDRIYFSPKTAQKILKELYK